MIHSLVTTLFEVTNVKVPKGRYIAIYLHEFKNNDAGWITLFASFQIKISKLCSNLVWWPLLLVRTFVFKLPFPYMDVTIVCDRDFVCALWPFSAEETAAPFILGSDVETIIISFENESDKCFRINWQWNHWCGPAFGSVYLRFLVNRLSSSRLKYSPSSSPRSLIN